MIVIIERVVASTRDVWSMMWTHAHNLDEWMVDELLIAFKRFELRSVCAPSQKHAQICGVMIR